MFINSIFLPKNISDQTLPEGVIGKTGGFSHLFSNVFRIISDEQETANLLPIINLNPETAENPQSELLKISLLSNKKLPIDTPVISKIVESFLTKINSDETIERSQQSKSAKIEDKISRLFSLSKNDFVKEIKNIVETIKNENSGNLENLNITLITNGKSINLNPLVTNVEELENWVTQQLQSNSDFEILVKRGKSKLTVDVETVKHEAIHKVTPLTAGPENKQILAEDIIQVLSEDENVKILAENIKSTDTQSAFQPQFQGLKQTSAFTKSNAIISDDLKQFNLTAIENTPGYVKVSKEINKVNISNDENINSTFSVNTTKNLANSFNQNQVYQTANAEDIVEMNSEIQTSTKNLAVDHKSQQFTHVKVNPIVISTVKESISSEKNVNIKSDAKAKIEPIGNLISKEKQSLIDLIEKTDVKNIEIKTQNYDKKNVNTQSAEVNSNKVPDAKVLNNFIVKENSHNKTIIDSEALKEPVKQVVSTENEKVNVSVESKIKTVLEGKNINLNTKPQDNVNENLKNNRFLNNSTQQELFTDHENEKNIYSTTVKTEPVKIINTENNKTESIVKENIPIEKSALNINKEQYQSGVKTENQIKSSDVKENLPKVDKPVLQNPEKQTDVKYDIKNTLTVKDDTKVAEDVKNAQTNKAVNVEEPKTVKLDFNQRRIFSQIPSLEVVNEKPEIKDSVVSEIAETRSKNENQKVKDQPVNTASNTAEQKVKSEKQVWVKVSFDNSDDDVVTEPNKTVPQNHKISIDVNTDSKKEFASSENTGGNLQDNQKQKTQNAPVESSGNTDTKSTINNQTLNNHSELAAGVKHEQKTELHQFKTEFNNENGKLNNRASEMVERVKVVSSGEMIREVYKVFETGEKQSIVLKLVPRDLGSVKIIIDSVDNLINAKVEVENESVGHLLRNNIEQLKHNLAQTGVNVNSVSISYQSSEQKQHNFNNQKRKNLHNQQSIEELEIDESVIIKKLGYNTYEYLA